MDDGTSSSQVSADMFPLNGTTPRTTTTEQLYVPVHRRPEMYIVPFVFALIFLVGVLGNGTLILIFTRHRNMRNVPNTYIISLALGDLFLILTSVPFTSTLYTFDEWPYGLFICKVSELAKDVSVGVSVFTLTALSVERYCAITNPIRRRISSKPCTLLTAIAIWMAATVLAGPSAYFAHLKPSTLVDNRTVIRYCYPFPEELGDRYRKSMVLFKFLAYYTVPLCVIASFYVSMAKHLEMTTRNMPGEMRGSQSTQIRARKKIAKTVLAFVILFMVCFLPHHVFMLWFHFNPTSADDFNDFWNTFRIVAFCLGFVNSCINPIALYFVSGVFRKYFNRYLFGCCGRNSTAHSGNNSTRANSVSCRRHTSLLSRQLTLTNTDAS